MKKAKRIILMYVFPVFILSPVLMWVGWYLYPKKKLVVAIIDKSDADKSGQEHVSVTWVLNHNRFTKTSSQSYDVHHDYYGFFPGDDHQFRLKGLERFSSQQLSKLSKDADIAYFTDTYGVYKADWYAGTSTGQRSGLLYGGLSKQDLDFLTAMKAAHKLIISEFNTIGSPTSAGKRTQFEKMFGIRWSGWSGRYFESFDTARNHELPRWMVRNYRKQHKGQWPFRKGGIAFVNNEEQIVILEDSVSLSDPVPHILSSGYGKSHLGLPGRIKYPFWFDIISPSLSINHAVSRFELSLNSAGRAELRTYGIPETFPAITMHKGRDYEFYYFSGDFCDNPVSMKSSYFMGVSNFRWMFYNSDDPDERKSFFWSFYRPMMTEILSERAARSGKR